MSGRERRKGVTGEREVRLLQEAAGFEVRGLEAGGDWLAFGDGLVLATEVKRHETARLWHWTEQMLRDAPAGTLPLLACRRSRSPWLGIAPLEPLLLALTRFDGERR